MRIRPWDPSDETTALACYEVHRAAHLADEPHEPPMPTGTFFLFLREGWKQNPGEVWTAADADGKIPGFYRMDLPDRGLESRQSTSTGRSAPTNHRHPVSTNYR